MRNARWIVGIGLIAIGIATIGMAADRAMPLMPIPSNIDEVRQLTRHNAWLTRAVMYSDSITLGNQCALLADDQLPIADRPHAPWAKPLPGGPLRVAFFTRANWHGQADMAEVAVRTDMRLYTVEYPGSSHPYMAELFPAEKEDDPEEWLTHKALKTLDRDLDVIVLGNMANRFPKKVMSRIMEKVKAGTGLVIGSRFDSPLDPERGALKAESPLISGGREKVAGAGRAVQILMPEVADGIPFEALYTFQYYNARPKPGFATAAKSGDAAAWIVGTIGKGRVLFLNTEGATIFPTANKMWREIEQGTVTRRYEEYMAAMAAKWIRWAAKRDPASRIKLSLAEGIEADKPFELNVALEGRNLDADLNLEATVRDFDFNTAQETRATMKAGLTNGAAVRMPLAAIPAGARFVIGVIARNAKGEAVDWAQIVADATAPKGLDFALQTDREIYKEGETVNISGRLTGGVNGDYTARVRIEDDTGRLLLEQTMPFGGDRMCLTYKLDNRKSAAYRAQATVCHEGRATLRKEAPFYCPRFGWDDYVNGLWAGWWESPYTFEAQLARLRDWAEVDCSSCSSGGSPMLLSRCGMRNYRLNDAVIHPNELYNAPDAPNEGGADTQLPEAIAATARYGTIAWSLNDERNQPTELSFAPAAEKSFHKWLAERWNNNVEQLNAAWGTAYKSFDEVKPIMAKELPTKPAGLAGWIDTRLFIRDKMMAVDTRHARQVREAMPVKQYIGIDGFGLDQHVVPYSGIDWGSMLTGPFNVYFPYTYPGYESDQMPQFHMLRALAPHDSPFPIIGGEKVCEKWQYYQRPWQQALAGGAGGVLGISRFEGQMFAHEYGYLFETARWFADAERPLRHGLGKLLLGARMEYDPVVFMFSYPSLMSSYAAGHWIDPENKHLLWRPGEANLASLQALMEDNGIVPDFDTDEQIANGSLKGRKLLVIPDIFGLALSDGTCKAIEAFVKDGGMVVAMMSPALYDERGRLRAKGGLDHVFGVTRDDISVAMRPCDYLVYSGKTQDARLPLDGWYIAEFYEKGLKLAGGKALGAHIFGPPTPAFVLNDFGKGRALLLNMLETQYGRYPYTDALLMMEQVLACADVKPMLGAGDAMNAYALRGYQLTRFNDGANLYVGAYRHVLSPAGYKDQASITLPREGHVYLAGGVVSARDGSMQTPVYLGHTNRVEVTLKGAGSALLAVLPYRIESLAVDMPKRATAGQTIELKIKIKTDGKAAGRHVVHVEVLRPDGMRHMAYSGNVEILGGAGSFAIPFALNDQPGEWTVSAREVVSNREIKNTLKVHLP